MTNVHYHKLTEVVKMLLFNFIVNLHPISFIFTFTIIHSSTSSEIVIGAGSNTSKNEMK